MRRRKCPPTSAGGMGPRRSVSGLPESSMAEWSRLRPKAGSTFRVPTASAVRVGTRRCRSDRVRTEWSVDHQLIERERILRGWTRRDLARAAHVDEKTLRDMLSARRRPTFGTVDAVATALGLMLPKVVLFPGVAQNRYREEDIAD